MVSTLDERKSTLCSSVPVGLSDTHWCGNPEAIQHPPTPPHSPRHQAEAQGLLKRVKRAHIYSDQQLRKTKAKPYRAAGADFWDFRCKWTHAPSQNQLWAESRESWSYSKESNRTTLYASKLQHQPYSVSKDTHQEATASKRHPSLKEHH